MVAQGLRRRADNPGMHRFVQRTWKPTSHHTTGVSSSAVRKDHPDPRHGTIAGAVLALAAQAVPLVFAFVWLAQVHPGGASD